MASRGSARRRRGSRKSRPFVVTTVDPAVWGRGCLWVWRWRDVGTCVCVGVSVCVCLCTLMRFMLELFMLRVLIR